MPYSSHTHSRRSMNRRYAQKSCVFSFTRGDQCVERTPLISPTYTVETPSSWRRSTRSRTRLSCAWLRRFVRFRYKRSIRLLDLRWLSSLAWSSAIRSVVSRNRLNSVRPAYRYCWPVVVVQATRLFAPTSKAASSEASGESSRESSIVTG